MSDMGTRGRPSTVRPDRIGLLAVELFVEHGYDAVSMSQIASRAGISRRSLFNHFPSKAALVWASFDPFLVVLDRALDAAEPSLPLLDAVEGAMLAALAALDLPGHALRVRLQIMSSHPELLVFGAEQMSAVRTRLQRFVEARLGYPADGLEALALAHAFNTTSFEALVRWATTSRDPTPAPTISGMLRALAIAGR